MDETSFENCKAARKRTWFESGCMPPKLARYLSESHRAVASVIAYGTAKDGVCRLAVAEIGDAAGVAEKTVRRTLQDHSYLFGVTGHFWRGGNKILEIEINDMEWSAWLGRGMWLHEGVFKQGQCAKNEQAARREVDPFFVTKKLMNSITELQWLGLSDAAIVGRLVDFIGMMADGSDISHVAIKRHLDLQLRFVMQRGRR